ncbi:MAG TPA: fibronectin type III domain-containing protein, partial [Pseudonocardia sp.]|nr:fibronectin type III domain-containing protein [Pseudonocardia sp.]
MTSLVATMLGVLVPTAAYANTGTVVFQNSFANSTVNGIGTVTKPTSVTNVACLTAAGNSATLPLLSCAGASDAEGSGKLRFTGLSGSEVGAVYGNDTFPTTSGLDVTFTAFQWGGDGGDGMSFMLAAVDPANPATPTSIGQGGGALGYTTVYGAPGLPNAYLGVGLDVWGGFSSSTYSGSGCSKLANFGSNVSGAVVARGPGNGVVGYCGLATTFNGTTASRVTLRADTRAASAVPVQVLINPTGSSFTSDSGQSVASGTYKVIVTPVGQAARTISGTLPKVAAGLYPSASWLTAGGIPKQLAFAFAGAAGGVVDVHEISDAKVVTFAPAAQLAVSTTSYSAATSGPGAPVTYQVAASVLAGANVASPVSVTHTVPVGVVPTGAYGTGWVCAAPVGRAITCTTSASAFANGTALPALVVNAIVTASSVSGTVIRSSSSTVVSATGASSATTSAMTAGTVSVQPTGVAISPAIGPIGGGGLATVTASTGGTPPTAIYIGTTAEQQAGTPVVLLPCPSGRAVGCFNIEGSALVIASMPARPTPATVTVTVVTLGIAGTTTYLYASSPAVPATPTATAGISSATLTWAAPANNGSPITGYVVTPYLDGVAQAPQTFDASTTTRTFTGLTAGGSYTFAVAATNAYGTSAASARSAAVVPYALPAAPVITAATAGSQSAVLSWSAPNNGGSAITGYVVTPYIGAVAQTPQTFTGTATTATVTGLTAGTAYTFRVAAQNLAGTGPQSAASASVTPNQSPSLAFAAPPAGQVGVAYSHQLTVTNGTAPFTWSISAGTLPAGLTLNATTGLLSGTPTAAGSSPVTVRVVDASGQVATRAITLVIAAAPTLTLAPPAGQVGVAYSHQPTLTGGTGPFVWRV